MGVGLGFEIYKKICLIYYFLHIFKRAGMGFNYFGERNRERVCGGRKPHIKTQSYMCMIQHEKTPTIVDTRLEL